MQWWIWLVAAVVLTVVEMLTPGGFYFVFFGAGAGAAALAALAGVDSLLAQTLIALAVSIGSLTLFRKPLLARFEATLPTAKVDSLVGESAIPDSTLQPGDFGHAELRGSSWKVRNISSLPIAAGQRCIVEQVDGLTLYIRAAD
jgi:membrane protein implicated in regulation of membrane protease activity